MVEACCSGLGFRVFRGGLVVCPWIDLSFKDGGLKTKWGSIILHDIPMDIGALQGHGLKPSS